MKNTVGITAAILLFSIVPAHAQSTEINSINIDCSVLKSGDAEITEKWDMDVYEGTEVYKSMYNMHQKDITLESVTDETGRKYTKLDSWDTDAADKNYRCGINSTDKGKEICMGINAYGHKTYTMKYHVSRFINQYRDTQGINYTFFSDMSIPVSKAKIKVKNANFSQKTKVWSFGYNGTVYPHKGHIEMESDDSPSRMQLLARTGGKFTSTDTTNSDMTFEKIRSNAFVGSSYKKATSVLENVGAKVETILFFLPMAITIAIVLAGPFLLKKLVRSHGVLKRKDGLKVPFRDIHPFRDIPDATPDELEFAAEHSGTMEAGGSSIAGYLMSWYCQGALEFTEDSSGRVNGFGFKKKPEIKGPGEAAAYKFFSEAGNYLTEKEFKAYCRHHEKKLEHTFYDIENGVKKSVDATMTRKMYFIEVPEYGNEYFEKAKQIYGLYKFLNDEGNMKDKKYIEVNLWKEYLVAASFFGIADKVAKQMSRIIPEMPEDVYNTVEVAICCKSFGHAGDSAVAEVRRSSGGGGSSSYGGGGSFSSGGGGGGVR